MRTALAGCSCIRLSRQWHRIQLLQRSLQRSPTAVVQSVDRALCSVQAVGDLTGWETGDVSQYEDLSLLVG